MRPVRSDFGRKTEGCRLGDAAIPLRIYADYSSFEGGVATGKQWLNLTSPLYRSNRHPDRIRS